MRICGTSIFVIAFFSIGVVIKTPCTVSGISGKMWFSAGKTKTIKNDQISRHVRLNDSLKIMSRNSTHKNNVYANKQNPGGCTSRQPHSARNLNVSNLISRCFYVSVLYYSMSTQII